MRRVLPFLGVVLALSQPAAWAWGQSAPVPPPTPTPTPVPPVVMVPAPTATPTPTAPVVTTGNCKASTHADGCPGAPARTPQFPTLLASYKKRAPWNVAGVDYGVGLPDGSSLKDPTTNPPAGCSYGGGTLSCSGDVTVQGYDFSLNNGVGLYVSGKNVTVKGNKFANSLNCIRPMLRVDVSGGGKLTYSSNDFIGSYSCTSAYAVVFIVIGTGSISELYNYFQNVPVDGVEIVGTAGQKFSYTRKWNLNNGLGAAGHADGIQFTAGNAQPVVDFNTYYSAGNPVIGQPLHIEAQLNAQISNASLSNNTVLTPGSCKVGTFPKNCWANYLLSCKADAPDPKPNTNTAFKADSNYLDFSGALGPIDSASAPCPGAQWTNNYDMKTGNLVSPSTRN